MTRKLPLQNTICADMPLDPEHFPLNELLEAFKGLAAIRSEASLVLAGQRVASSDYSIWNFLEENHLLSRVKFLPYYHALKEFPFKKIESPVWVERDTPPSELTTETLLDRLDGNYVKSPRTALFFTSFHPEKHEGHSTLMRIWLSHLRKAGYRIHLVYYAHDVWQVTEEMRTRCRQSCDLYLEVEVKAHLVGVNKNGLNVHVDDWCGAEAVKAVAGLCSRFEYDVAIVNYAFMSAVFDNVRPYTKKILLAHDSFADRNRRMLAEGYESATWVSLTKEGERLACSRSDVTIALQKQEAEAMRKFCGDADKIQVISPVMPIRGQESKPRATSKKLRIGYFGSRNWVNEQNFALYLSAMVEIPGLADQIEVRVAGGIDPDLLRHATQGKEVFKRIEFKFLGPIEDLRVFFDSCDIMVNPDRGGTGMKIKTIESLAAGAAVITTKAAAVGIESKSRFHSAKDAVALAKLTAELVAKRSLVKLVRQESIKAYANFYKRNCEAMDKLLGAPLEEVALMRCKPIKKNELKIPGYVLRVGRKEQIENFTKFFERVDIRQKRVLEIGSDFNLITGRLFAANGAMHVLATHISDWGAKVPPAGIETKSCDICKTDLSSESFDIIYGTDVLDHITDMSACAKAINRLLKTDGIAYFRLNTKSPGKIIKAFAKELTVKIEQTKSKVRANEYYKVALKHHKKSDLSVDTLTLWGRPKKARVASVNSRKPKVSIVVPFYQVEQYFAECIESILSQDYQDLEIILVDDASRDQSLAIAKRFAAKDDRIHIVTHPANRGLGQSRNTGVTHATGDYLFFLDSDDFLTSPSVISKLVATASRNNMRVTVGACLKLLPNGRVLSADEIDSRSSLNGTGGEVDGKEAFMAGLRLPTPYYLPLRAWGALIKLSWYRQIKLDYTVGEHEDFSHTAFLYYLAGTVLYVSEAIVTYRIRPESISGASWSEGRFSRYENLWQDQKAKMYRYELWEYVGDAALSYINHMMWRLQQGALDPSLHQIAVNTIRSIFRDVTSVKHDGYFYHVIDGVQRFCRDFLRKPSYFREIIWELPLNLRPLYYRRNLGLHLIDAKVTAKDKANPKKTIQIKPQNALLKTKDEVSALNQERMNLITGEYGTEIGGKTKSVAAMLSQSDRALYFWCARHFSFKGAIVDVGSFVGGTTIELIQGLLRNPSLGKQLNQARKLVRTYDFFKVDDNYILEQFKRLYPAKTFQYGDEYKQIFEDNIKEFTDFIDMRQYSASDLSYADKENIGLLGIDLCRTPFMTDAVVRTLFPRLMPGAMLIQQDFTHEYHPHIPLSMSLLADHFERFVELDRASSVAYKCIRKISPETILERFGNDISWYADINANAKRLASIADTMLYETNQWKMMLACATYYAVNGYFVEACKAYNDAVERFPKFRPSRILTKMFIE